MTSANLLLLATGTQADTNGAANFTQQFSVNGQRGTATVFSMDGVDTTDPELGGATLTNFNVDAIEDIESDSGVMPAEVGHGAAGYTAVKTKAGTNNLHGSVFEFVRNAAFDARNFFDLLLRRAEAWGVSRRFSEMNSASALEAQWWFREVYDGEGTALFISPNGRASGKRWAPRR